MGCLTFCRPEMLHYLPAIEADESMYLLVTNTMPFGPSVLSCEALSIFSLKNESEDGWSNTQDMVFRQLFSERISFLTFELTTSYTSFLLASSVENDTQ
jgi:hypothetical protein